MRRRILMLVAALALAALSSFPASAAVECNCTYCQQHPSAFCDIRVDFHTNCTSYYSYFCVE